MRDGAKTGLARRLRKTGNTAEQMAWRRLRTLRSQGFPVRRQHPIGPYVVDFAIIRARLVAEIDGGVHREPEVMAQDALRQSKIEALGWRVLRLPPEIATSPDHLLDEVTKELGI